MHLSKFSHYHPNKKYYPTDILPMDNESIGAATAKVATEVALVKPLPIVNPSIVKPLPIVNPSIVKPLPIVTPSYKKNIRINVDISQDEYISVYKKAMRECSKMDRKNTSYYKSYLKNILGNKYDSLDIEYIMRKIDQEFEYVDFAISTTKPKNHEIVTNILNKGEYFSQNTQRTGLIVKMAKTMYDGKESVVKIYLYIPTVKMIAYSVETNFKNEIVFQNYAKQMNKPLDFISPEIYAIGKIRTYKYLENGTEYRCLFIIMEYIPGITLKHAIYSPENMKDIYERVDEINGKMKSVLLHHNDLHSSNIILRNNDTPRPDVCIIDFGEAACGPTEKIYA